VTDWMWWWLGFCVVAGCLVTGTLSVAARSRDKSPAPIRKTGVVVDRAFVAGTTPSWRRTGSGVLRGTFGKTSASWPLCVLELERGELTLRFRPAFVAACFGVRPVRTSTTGDSTAFPVKGRFGARFVGIRTANGEGYFRTARPEELLGTLEASGLMVSLEEEKMAYR
jgi:hypothetical protein